MAEHLALETIDSYRAGTLTPDWLLAVDDHLAACDDCRARAEERIDVSSSAATLFRTLGRRVAIQHCLYETLEAYVDGRLPADEHQQVGMHLDECALCAEDLGDLRHARALLNTEAAESARPEGIVGTLTGLWRLRWIRYGGGAVAAALGVWLLFATGTRDLGSPNQTPREAPAQASGDAVPPVKDRDPSRDPRGAAVVAALQDGRGEVVLREGGDLSGLPTLSRLAREAVSTALTTGRLSVVATATLAPRPGTLRGSDEERRFDVTEPVGRVVESDLPTFRWTAHPSARAYRVAAFDASFTEVLSSGEVTGTEWTPSSALPRGKVLTWQVTALTPEGPVQAPTPPAAEARFAVLAREQADELQQVRRTDPESHLALAVLYARAGMTDEAARELKSLAQRNPDSALARQLLASVQTPR